MSEETVEVVLRLPKPVCEFYRALATNRDKSLEQFLENYIVEDISSFLDVEDDIKEIMIR